MTTDSSEGRALEARAFRRGHEGAFPSLSPSAAVIGNFDGVHRGHQAVLAEAAAAARTRGLVLTVLTFDPHPAAVLGGEAPPQLTALGRRAALLLRTADRLVVQTFARPFAATPPEAFARDLLAGDLSAKLVVVGEDFRFGHKRAGDRATLAALGAAHGFEVIAPQLAGDGAGRYSSSRARDAAAAGDTMAARAVLGRDHSFAGLVVTGDQRGRTLGAPTANLAGMTEIVPARGVYAVRVDEIVSPEDALVEELRPLGGGVFNHGVRPTVAAGLRATVEVHVLDADLDLYGRRLRVHVVEKLRDEQRFADLAALKAQIALDLAAARAALRGSAAP